MGLFKEGSLVAVEGSVAEALDEESGESERITAPADMSPEMRDAYLWLQKAQSHLLRGNFRACIEFAADAVNQVAVTNDLHGYASY